MNNIRDARIRAGYSQKQVALELKVSAPTVSEWENGKKNPISRNLEKMSDMFNVSIDYLLGRDDQISNVPSPSVPGAKWVPVLGYVRAGIPTEAVEEILDYEEISPAMAAQGDYFALKIKGSSMEPRIHEGDVVIVRKQDDADTGDVAVVVVNGDDATVKRIKKGPEGLMLIPSNPAFEPMFYSNDEVNSLPVTILGKVVELRAKF